MESGLVTTRRMASLMRGPLGALSQRGALVVVIGLLLAVAAARGAFANQAPVADAGADQDVYFGDTVFLQGSATDPDGDAIVSWAWAFEAVPEGSTAVLCDEGTPDPSFVPDLAGSYTVSLVVSDGTDWSIPDTVGVRAFHPGENLPPVAIATADVTSGFAPLTVHFDGSQSYDPEGEPLSFYWWNLGDGDQSYEMSPTHVYNFCGFYGVILYVYDQAGAYGYDYIYISVEEPANQAPVASPTATPNSGTASLTVQFAANASDPDGDPLTYFWGFGDSNTSTDPDPLHTYTYPGSYLASVTVSDGDLAVTESLVIAVDPGLDLSVSSAAVKWLKPGVGKVHLWADFAADLPGPDDMIAVYLDGICLFAAPFSDFHTEVGSGPYVLADAGLLVRLDFGQGKLFLVTPKTPLNLDLANGVDVELWLGSAVGVENIPMTQTAGGRLVY